MRLEKEKEEFDKVFKKEKEQKEEYFKKSNIMEKRCLEAQAELLIHRQKTHKFDEDHKKLEKKLREVQNEYSEQRERMESENYRLRQMYDKAAQQRDVMKRALQEYEKYLIGTLTKQLN